MSKRYLVKVDFENNCSRWWESYDNSGLYLNICQGRAVELNQRELDALKALPGWVCSCAPEYAPHPLTAEEL